MTAGPSTPHDNSPAAPDAHAYSTNGGIARYFVEHREVAWMALIAVLVWGWLSYRALPQQEDPPLSRRIARVITVLPGATASTVEQLVTKPVERKIAELESIDEMTSESHAGISVITLGQRPASTDTIDEQWDQLRAKLAELSLPEGCFSPDLRTDFGSIITLLLAVTAEEQAGAAPSYRDLEVVADRLAENLRQIPSVGRTQKLGAVRENVRLVLDPAKSQAPGVSLYRAVEGIQHRNQLVAGGSLHLGEESLPVRVEGAFRNEDDLGDAIIGAAKDGRPIAVRDVFEVRRDFGDPLPEHVDFLSRAGHSGKLARQRSVLLAVEMKPNQVIGDFGREVQASIDKLRPSLPAGIHIETVSDQPKSVDRRIQHFTECFVEAVLVVIAVALLLMEWRAALIVALAIPLTIAMTVGGMQIAGLALHQISIAALIIALGMLVDDPVVAADGINREIANGRPRSIAAWLGPFKLRRPILFATIINILAFLPLVLLPGDKKTFIYALPIVVTLALVASRIVSMTFIPLLGYYLLRGQRGFDQGGQIRRGFPFGLIDRLFVSILPAYRGLLEGALRRPWLAVVLAYGMLAASFALTPYFGHQFFPPAERNQLLIDVQLPESASSAATERVCRDIVSVIEPYPEITSAALFLGFSAPRFYYNVTPKPPGEHVAQFLVNTRDAAGVPNLISRLRTQLDTRISGARCVVKQLEQGPPMDTPIQVRITGGDLNELRRLADEVSGKLRQAGAYQAHDDLGEKFPSLEIGIDHDKANALGVFTPQIALAVRAATADVKITELREGDHLVPVKLTISRQNGFDDQSLGDLPIESVNGQVVTLNQFAAIQRVPSFATIAHFHQERAVTVKSYAPIDQLPSQVVEKARPEIDRIALPSGYRLEYVGEEKELNQSRVEMARVMAISLSLIALAMVIQFNSVVKSVVVMLTVPLGLIGGFVGLALFHAPLGFMAMLAIVSLAGVIVSHIIVLSDSIEEGLSHGRTLEDALVQAGLVRMRPVLVTVLATAGGLVPLALTGGELWRPLTAVHIFGLILATVLTLFLLPVFYSLFCKGVAPRAGSTPR